MTRPAPSRPSIVVYGAGGHGRVVADILLAASVPVLGFVDDGVPGGTTVMGLPVLGGADWIDAQDPGAVSVALGIGSNEARQERARLLRSLGVPLVTAIHPRSTISPGAEVAAGAAVMAGGIVNPGATIAEGAIVNTGAVVEHDCIVGEYSHVSPGAVLAGGVSIGAGVHVGAGATAVPGVRIGAWSLIGAGAVVVRDIGERQVAYGVPARVRGTTGVRSR